MKNLNKLFLLGAILLTTNIFADDIWFIAPQPGQPVQGQMQIKIQPPYGNPLVHVWMEYDMGRDTIVWRGQLTAANNYTATVDTTKFQPGKYEIEAEYYIQGRDFDGSVDVWIGGTAGPNGEYFPQ